jgi:hypothetical protein
MDGHLDGDPLPDPARVGGQLDLFLRERDRIGALSDQIAALRADHSLRALHLMADVGDDVVILYRGLAFVPYQEGTSRGRSGYDTLTCLDVDAIRKPVILAIGPDDQGGGGGGDGTAEFPRVADHDHLFD